MNDCKEAPRIREGHPDILVRKKMTLARRNCF
jgi:hypothetical protein